MLSCPSSQARVRALARMYCIPYRIYNSNSLFKVPLNYSEPISSSNKASIAVVRSLSPYSPTSQNYKGPLLFNPGGPGGSGIDTVLTDGGLLRLVAGDAFDIIGFDPRGMCHFMQS